MATVDLPNSLSLSLTVPPTAFTLDGFREWRMSDEYPEHARITFAGGRLYIELTPDIGVTVPPDANTLEGFRAWALSPKYPKRGKITFAKGRLFIDMSPERIDLHAKVKAEVAYVITGIVKTEQLGEFYPDGVWITNDQAGLSNEPDASFASWDTLKSGRLAPPIRDGSGDRFTQLVGAPDWVCEIVSDSSEEKDGQSLLKRYHEAGVREYWLIDARDDAIDFKLFVWQPGGFEVAESNDGWNASQVFRRAFKLTRSRDQVGRWQYDLLTR